MSERPPRICPDVVDLDIPEHQYPEQTEIIEKHGTCVIFHIRATDEFLFFRRDDKPTIPYPDRVCPIGGGRDPGESPDEAIRREVAEELYHQETNKPFILGEIAHLGTLPDNRPGEIDVFACELDERPAIYTVEGQGLVFLSREETLQTAFPYGFDGVVHWYAQNTLPLQTDGL
jgi:hypothetical protein